MASQKIKFKMTVKELSFEFEGDIEQGQKIQSGITKALGEISNLQNGAMGLPPTRPAEARVVEPSAALAAPSRPRRRRRRGPAASGEEGAEALEGTEGETARGGARKPSGASPKKLLIELRKDNFFNGGKGQGDIVAELDKRGHTKILATSLPGALAKLVQDKVLSREKGADGTWVYSPGVNNG